jgi:hypothetical protein
MPRKIGLTFILMITVLTGFLREFLFTRINEYLFSLWYDEPSYAIHSLPVLSYFDYESLYWTKWGLTLLFAFLFYGLTNFALKFIFNEYYWKITGGIYLLILFLAGISMTIGYAINDLKSVYPFARFMMGMIQSPLILMIMVPGLWLQQQKYSR